MQNIACERMEKFEAFNQDRIRSFLRSDEVLKQKNSVLMTAIAELIQESFFKNPLTKFSAYKNLLSLYQKYRPIKVNINNKNESSDE